MEKELLGFYLTDHPLNQYLPLLAAKCSHRINDLLQESEKKKDKLVNIGGMVTSLRLVLTKANAQEMVFAKIEDDSGSIEAVVFPKVYSRTKECWAKNQMVLVKGRVQIREESPNLVVDEARLLEKEQEKEIPQEKIIDWDFEVTLPSQLSPRKLVELNKLLKQKQGKNKLALAFVDHSGRVKRLVLPFGVDYSEELEKEIKKIIEE